MTRAARACAAIFLFGISLWACTQKTLLSPTQFSAAYVEAVHARAPQIAITTRGPLHLEVAAAESDTANIYLNNAYARYRANPHAAEEIIDDYVTGMLEPFEKAKQQLDIARVVPVVKDSGYLADLNQSANANLVIAHDSYNAHLNIYYAEDTPRSVRYLSEQDLEDVGLVPAERRARSIENLKALLPKVRIHGSDGVYFLTVGGAYEASLLLFDKLWQIPALKVMGEIVVAVPARDILMVTGSEDDQGLDFVRRKAAEIASQSPYRLTRQLFIYQLGRFVPFDG